MGRSFQGSFNGNVINATVAKLVADHARDQLADGVYLTDDGLYVNYNNVLSAAGGGSPYVAHTTNDWDDVLQAFQDLQSTGGTIVLPPGYIDVDRKITPTTGYSQGLIPISNGIKYVGAGNTFNNQSNFEPATSTILRNTTGVRQPMLAWNAVDRGTPYANASDLNARWLLNAGLSFLSIQGGDYGIKIGALNEAGMRDCIVEEVFCYDNTLYGMWFENCEGADIIRPYCWENRHGFAFVASGGALWNHGNSRIFRPKCYGHRSVNGDPRNGRGLAVLARNGSQMNDVYVYDVQGGGTGDDDLSTVTMTMTSGNPDISVPDVSKFEPGMVVIPNATAGGFTANTSRMVSAVSGTSGAGTIRLCNSQGGLTAANGNGGTVLTPSASTTLSVNVRGFAPVEFGGLDFGSYIAACGMVGKTDIEVGGSCAVLVRDTSGFRFDTNVLSVDTAPHHVILRNNFNQRLEWRNSSGNAGMDADGAPTYTGAQPFPTTISAAQGFYRNATNQRGILHLGCTTGGLDLFNDGNASNAAHWNAQQILAVGSRNFVANESPTLPNNIGNIVFFTGSTGGTPTLPSVFNSNFNGSFLFVVNATANSFTVNGNAGQQIYDQGVGASSFTLGARAIAALIGIWDGTVGAWYRVR